MIIYTPLRKLGKNTDLTILEIAQAAHINHDNLRRVIKQFLFALQDDLLIMCECDCENYLAEQSLANNTT